MHEYARLINAVAKSDTTAPPCWVTDEVLKAVERVVITNDQQPLLFALICRDALADIVENPYVRELLNLGVFNGIRRTDGVDVAEVNTMFQACQTKIAALPADPRKTRLQNFVRYQGRVFMARNGLYQQAMVLEEEEVAVCVREAEKSVSRFLAQLYRIWGLISVQEVGSEIWAAIRTLRKQLAAMQVATKGTNLEVLWGLSNGPVHMLQVLLLTNLVDSGLGWTQYLQTVRENLNHIAPGSRNWITVIEALIGDKGALQATITSLHTSADVKAATRLVLARLNRCSGRLDEARAMYASIQPVPNGHMIAAVAKRELAALTGAPPSV